MIADHFTDMQAAVNDGITRNELLPAFVNLLGDSEAEVRTAIASKLMTFCCLLPAEIRLGAIMKNILPQIQVCTSATTVFYFLPNWNWCSLWCWTQTSMCARHWLVSSWASHLSSAKTSKSIFRKGTMVVALILLRDSLILDTPVFHTRTRALLFSLSAHGQHNRESATIVFGVTTR